MLFMNNTINRALSSLMQSKGSNLRTRKSISFLQERAFIELSQFRCSYQDELCRIVNTIQQSQQQQIQKTKDNCTSTCPTLWLSSPATISSACNRVKRVKAGSGSEFSTLHRRSSKGSHMNKGGSENCRCNQERWRFHEQPSKNKRNQHVYLYVDHRNLFWWEEWHFQTKNKVFPCLFQRFLSKHLLVQNQGATKGTSLH